MWSRGTRRPPRPPKRFRRSKSSPAQKQRHWVREASSPAPRSSASVWRRLRHRLRVLWRWVVVRNWRHLAMQLAGKPEPVEYGSSASLGDVRQFPNGR